MENFKLYKDLIEKLPIDVRFEVLLAEIILDGVNMDDVEVLPNSIFNRNYHRDIEKVEEFEYPGSRRKRLRFIVNRDGLYDSLPQNFFHRSEDTVRFRDTESKLQEIKLQHAREEAARKFFLPYEQEFFRLRLKLELEERKFMSILDGDEGTSITSQLWGFPDFLDDDQRDALGLLMPVMHMIAGKFKLCSFIASKISGDEVEIERTNLLANDSAENPSLKEATLGIDFILGGLQHSTVPCVHWSISVNGDRDVSEYLQNGRKAKVHEFLSNLMIPLENDVSLQLHFSEHSTEFILNDHPTVGRLGYNLYLNN